MKVGAERDWELDVYLATWETGEQGIHLRFRREQWRRAEEQFVIFLGEAEALELAARLEDRFRELKDAR